MKQFGLASAVLLGGIAGFFAPTPAGEGGSLGVVASRLYLIPLVTTVGGLCSGILVYGLAPEAEGHGTDAAIDAFHNKKGEIRSRIPLVKVVASAITIGSGGSAGREGPTAQMGAGFGSFLSKRFNLSVHDRRIAVAVGIGAGIGSIFKAPFGGAIMSAEILYMQDFEVETLLPAFIASTVGYSIFASYAGWTPIFGNLNLGAFNNPIVLPFYAVLGIICGLVGIVYVKGFYGTRALFQRLRIPRFLKPALGGLLVGIIGMFLPQVLGMGYGWLQILMSGNFRLTPYHFDPNNHRSQNSGYVSYCRFRRKRRSLRASLGNRRLSRSNTLDISKRAFPEFRACHRRICYSGDDGVFWRRRQGACCRHNHG